MADFYRQHFKMQVCDRPRLPVHFFHLQRMQTSSRASAKQMINTILPRIEVYARKCIRPVAISQTSPLATWWFCVTFLCSSDWQKDCRQFASTTLACKYKQLCWMKLHNANLTVCERIASVADDESGLNQQRFGWWLCKRSSSGDANRQHIYRDVFALLKTCSHKNVTGLSYWGRVAHTCVSKLTALV